MTSHDAKYCELKNTIQNDDDNNNNEYRGKRTKRWRYSTKRLLYLKKQGRERKKNLNTMIPLISPRKSRVDSFSDSIDRASDEELELENVHSTQVRISVSRTVTCPDNVRVDRCYRLPEYGPKILFFSGGSAMRDLASVLKNYTHNSCSLITPFDSGGSSVRFILTLPFPLKKETKMRSFLMILTRLLFCFRLKLGGHSTCHL